MATELELAREYDESWSAARAAEQHAYQAYAASTGVAASDREPAPPPMTGAEAVARASERLDTDADYERYASWTIPATRRRRST